MEKKHLNISIISDVHLGTYECHYEELLKYLQSIKPEVLVLNGDFIDIPKLRKNKIPKTHLPILSEIIDMAFGGTKVYYISNNKELVLQKVPEFFMKNIYIRDNLELQLKKKKYWIFHGDVFDPLLKIPSFVIKPGGRIYKLLMKYNRLYNKWQIRLGRNQMSYSGKAKIRVKQSRNLIKCFEETAVQMARQQGYDYVICGHIHEPVIKHFNEKKSSVTYMNSGDWVENLTALEYRIGRWQIYNYDELDFTFINPKLHVRSKREKNTEDHIKRSERFGSIVETDNLHPDPIVRKQQI